MKLLDYNGILSKRYALVAVFSILALLAFASSAMAGCCFLNNYQISISKPSAQECSDAGGIAFFDADCSKPALTAYTQPLCCVINVSNTFKCYYGSLAYFNYTRYSNELMQYDYVCRPGDYGEDGYNGCISDPMGGCPSPAPTPKCSPLGCLNYLSSSLYCTYSGAIISNCSYCLENDCGGLVCNQETGQCENLGTGCSATGYSCCASCADENKQNSTFNYDSSNPSSDRCPSNAPKCCESCAVQNYCCKYSWQCSYALPSIDTCAGTNCGSACAEPQCVLGERINSESNINNPVCWCGGEEKNTTSDSGYCCYSGYSQGACSELQPSFYGNVTSSDGTALSGAVVIVDNWGVASQRTGSDGSYRIYGLSNGKYTLIAYLPNYYISSKSDLQYAGYSLKEDFTLTPVNSAQCNMNSPSNVISSFNATAYMQGKPDVKLSWNGICSGLIASYYIKRNDASAYKMVGNSEQYIDTSARWNTTYKYYIKARYKNGKETTPINVFFTTGDPLCDGVYPGYEFCGNIVSGRVQQKNTEDATLRFTCNALNQVVSSESALYINGMEDGYETNNCSLYAEAEGAARKCALTRSAEGEVISRCIKVNACENSGNPFGLFYLKESCTQDSSCFFDFSRTTVDSCNSCRADLTCAEFTSQDACENNACGLNCTWDCTNPELEKGICYSQTGNASSCEACNSMFMNCDEEACSKLGSCMMNNGICSSCAAAGITSCSNYTTQYDCEGKSFSKADFEYCSNGNLQSASSTNDACNMLRCAWNDTSCVKDGNYDKADDCAIYTTPFSLMKCRADNTPPISSVLSINYSDGRLLFNISQNENISKFYYCIDDADSCCPQDSSINFGQFGLSRFTISSPFDNQPGTYYLRYYAVDIYSNQETIESYPIIITTAESSLVASLNYYFTQASRYNLTVFVYTDKRASCSFAIDGDAQSKVYRNTFGSEGTDFEADFANLNYSSYLLTLNCTSGALTYYNKYVLKYGPAIKFNITIIGAKIMDGVPAVTYGDYDVLMNFTEPINSMAAVYRIDSSAYDFTYLSSDDDKMNWKFRLSIPRGNSTFAKIRKDARIFINAIVAETGSPLSEEDSNSPYFTIDTKPPVPTIVIDAPGYWY